MANRNESARISDCAGEISAAAELYGRLAAEINEDLRSVSEVWHGESASKLAVYAEGIKEDSERIERAFENVRALLQSMAVGEENAASARGDGEK